MLHLDQGGKNYIKIHYPYPYDKVRIIENRGNQTGKERFESLKEKIAQTSLDAEKNTTLIFEQSLSKLFQRNIQKYDLLHIQ